MGDTANILEIQGITKIFPGVTALDAVDLSIRKGEVHVLVGENGAGKSSLVKILCGIYPPDSGRMYYSGEEYIPRIPLDAMKAGIRVVYQEFNLLSYLSVAENIFFDRLPRKLGGIVDFRRLYSMTEDLLKKVGLGISPKTPVALLGVAQMQLVEIAKALSSESRVLILDEPTATLTSNEIAKLFEIIGRLKEQGVTIIYISHRLQELFQIGDRVTVLRNGQLIGTRPVEEVSIPDIVRMMVGRELEVEYPFDDSVRPGEEFFRVEDLKYRGNHSTVSFGLRRGEILGIAGLVGSGRTETVRAIFGADPKESGRISLNGAEISIRRPKDAVRHGICLLTEDRKDQGLILDMPCSVNITITDLRKISRSGLLQFAVEKRVSQNIIDDLDIKTPSIHKWVRHLSGGNQQKVVLGKWLFRQADILILDEPTRGIDVGAKYEIYMLLWRLAALGKGLIVISSDLPELIGICHRMIVFSNGRIAGEVMRAAFDQEKILQLAYREYLKGSNTETKGGRI